MLSWGDKDAAERLAGELRELLRDRTLTYDQLASRYSIKYGHSVTQRLKDVSGDRRPMPLGDFLAEMTDFFTLPGGKNQVCARRPGEGGGGGSGGPSINGAGPSAVPSRAAETKAEQPPVVAAMKYADVSRGIQSILKEQQEPMSVEQLEDVFRKKFANSIPDIVGMTTGEYLQRKENIFDYTPERGTVFLQSSVTTGPPTADPTTVKDEAFVVREFEQLVEAMGPVVYISTLCGKFIQRNGISVSSVISTRPLDLFKRHPGKFLIVGGGNVTLKKFEQHAEVQRLLDKPSSKALRIAKAAEEAQLPVPEVVEEEHVVKEFRRLILADGTDSVYISSLCGRFLQRFKKPVTSIITCKPAEFLRRYPDIFVMTGGGNVGLREVLGPDAVSVPPPPPRMPKSTREAQQLSDEALEQIELNEAVYYDIHGRIAQGVDYQALVQRLSLVCREIERSCFLALEEVTLGGAASKGLVAAGPQAEIVLFVKQLPFKNFTQWLPHILDTLSPVLEYQLASFGAGKFRVEKDRLHFQLAAGSAREQDVMVDLFVSPKFKDRAHLLESIVAVPPAERHYLNPAMVKERADLVARQSRETKVLIRLATWWVSKQTWSSALASPSDWMVELLVIYACQLQAKEGGSKANDLACKLDQILEMFANFESIKVTWEGTGVALYASQDIWKPLMSHQPLVMDPINPFCNLADASTFDARELVAKAKRPGCLHCFRREAAECVFESADEEEDENQEDAGG
mmetsp:Transcript_9249/g.20561  ORF Transcript_9249/g.20561 Transcript_9249/m.20561 type:complete len:743 (-) Transcript_9249:79-2307(-)